MAKLGPSERKLLAAYERGEVRPAANEAQVKARLVRIARAHLKKQERINIRLSKPDLDGLRFRAAEEGLPYQTLAASLIHKYVSGRLVEKPSR